MTSTSDLATSASSSPFDIGRAEHSPLRFHLPRYLQDVVEASPEVGVEDHFHSVLSQTFPADLHYLLGPALSVFPAESNSPPGGDQLSALLLSLPECPAHLVADQRKRLQSH